MTMNETPPTETWDLDDSADCSPGDYLIGCIEGHWTGDEESQSRAVLAILAATLRRAGLTPEEAADKAIEQVGAGVSIGWDGQKLSIKFDDTETP